MENQIQYVQACEIAMFSYLKSGNSNNLVQALKKVERHAKKTLKGDKDKSLWFKFSKDDTLTTHIRDIEVGLNPTLTSKNNIDFLKEEFMDIITLDGELRVFYS